MTQGTVSLLFVWGAAGVLGATVYVKRPERLAKALRFAAEEGVVVGPRIVVAVLAASFLAGLFPPEGVAAWVGPESGLRGLLVASLAGAMVPGGPIVAMPLAALLKVSGAGVPQLVAFVTAWSIYAAHRILIYELSWVGWRFTLLRLGVCLPAPPLAGFIAYQLT